MVDRRLLGVLGVVLRAVAAGVADRAVEHDLPLAADADLHRRGGPRCGTSSRASLQMLLDAVGAHPACGRRSASTPTGRHRARRRPGSVIRRRTSGTSGRRGSDGRSMGERYLRASGRRPVPEQPAAAMFAGEPAPDPRVSDEERARLGDRVERALEERSDAEREIERGEAESPRPARRRSGAPPSGWRSPASRSTSSRPSLIDVFGSVDELQHDPAAAGFPSWSPCRRSGSPSCGSCSDSRSHDPPWATGRSSRSSPATRSRRSRPAAGPIGAALQYRMLVEAGSTGRARSPGSPPSTCSRSRWSWRCRCSALPAFIRGAVNRGLVEATLIGVAVFAVLLALGATMLAFDGPLRWVGRQVQAIRNRLRRSAEPLRHPPRAPAARARPAAGDARPALEAARSPRPSRRWAFDYATLLAALAAVGSTPRPALVLLAFCAAQVLAQVPVTPGGLGFVEAGLTATLALAGVGAVERRPRDPRLPPVLLLAAAPRRAGRLHPAPPPDREGGVSDRVTFVGHSTVRMELGGTRLITDPLLRAALPLRPPACGSPRGGDARSRCGPDLAPAPGPPRLRLAAEAHRARPVSWRRSAVLACCAAGGSATSPSSLRATPRPSARSRWPPPRRSTTGAGTPGPRGRGHRLRPAPRWQPRLLRRRHRPVRGHGRARRGGAHRRRLFADRRLGTEGGARASGRGPRGRGRGPDAPRVVVPIHWGTYLRWGLNPVRLSAPRPTCGLSWPNARPDVVARVLAPGESLEVE